MERDIEHPRNRENHVSVYERQYSQSVSSQALSASTVVVPFAVWITCPPVKYTYRAKLLHHYSTMKLMDK